MQEIVLVIKRPPKTARPAAPLYQLCPYSLLGATVIYVLLGLVLYFIPWKLASGMWDLHTQDIKAIWIQVLFIIFVFVALLCTFMSMEVKITRNYNNKSVTLFDHVLPLILNKIPWLVVMKRKNMLSKQSLLFARVSLSIVFFLLVGMVLIAEYIDRKWPSSILISLMLIYTFVRVSFWLPMPSRFSKTRWFSISPANLATYVEKKSSDTQT